MAKRQQTETARKLTRAAKAAAPKPRSGSLPGLEDHAIKPLENVATEYADIRDQRMELTKQEVDLKQRAMKLMKKYGKTVYRHNGCEILIEPGEEVIKVKVKKEQDLDADPSGPAAPPDEGDSADA